MCKRYLCNAIYSGCPIWPVTIQLRSGGRIRGCSFCVLPCCVPGLDHDDEGKSRRRSAAKARRVMCVNAITRVMLTEGCDADAVTRVSRNVSITSVVRLFCFPLFLVKDRVFASHDFCSKARNPLPMYTINRHRNINIPGLILYKGSVYDNIYRLINDLNHQI